MTDPRFADIESHRPYLLRYAQDRGLTATETEALQYHLGRCVMCRNFDSQLKFLRKASERFRAGAD